MFGPDKNTDLNSTVAFLMSTITAAGSVLRGFFMEIVFNVLAILTWLMLVSLIFSPIILAISCQRKATGKIVLFCLLGFVPFIGVIFWVISLVRALRRDDDDGRRGIPGWFLIIYFFAFLMLAAGVGSMEHALHLPAKPKNWDKAYKELQEWNATPTPNSTESFGC